MMPIVIYPKKSPSEKLACLCDDCWELTDQIPVLEEWLSENKMKVASGEYVADIGFTPRNDASGGGTAISPESMRTMAELGMWLFLSEYSEIS
jgi:hypothetical protein